MACRNSLKRLPSSLIPFITSSIRNPSGQWADYNCVHAGWRKLGEVTDDVDGLICEDDRPEEPKVGEYNNFDGERGNC